MCLMAAVCLLSSIPNTVYASDTSNMYNDSSNKIQPRNTNIKYSTVSLSRSGAIAKCSASITAYASNTSFVSINLYLQKYNNNNGWKTVQSWYDSKNSNIMEIYRTSSISSGRYRLKATYRAQNETITKYSSEMVY